MQELKLPKRGQAMEEGTIVEWRLDEGDPVEAGETVVVFETDKTTADLQAEQDGRLLAKLIEEGETVPIGTTLGYVGTAAEADRVPDDAGSAGASGGGDPAGGATGPGGADEGPTPATLRVDAGESGDAGADGEVRATPSARRFARERGVALEAVGERLGSTTVRREDVEAFVDGRADAAGNGTENGAVGEVRGSPAAMRVAEKRDVDLAEVGEALGESRVRMADVESYAESIAAGETAPGAAEAAAGPAATTDPAADGRAVHETVPVSGARKTMHDRMQRVSSEYGSTTTVAKVDVTDLLELRESLSDAWAERHGTSPSLTAFVVRAVAEALGEFRMLNAEIVSEDGQATEVRQFEDVNVGIAVDTDHGLLVPTIYDADERTVRELSAEVGRLAEAARERELDFEDQRNGTFTVSNAGTFGAYINTPRINPPQTAILGTCAVVTEPGVVDGEVVPREFMHLCLTYDHRVVEGATAVQFLRTVADRLEAPASLLE